MDRIIKIYRKVTLLRPSGFWPGFIIGLIYFSWTLWWFWSSSVYISLLLGTTSNVLAFWVILPTFILTVAGISLFWGFFSRVIYNFKKIRPILLPFFYAGTFVLLEYLRTWFVGILLYGSGGTLGANWTFGNPAYLFVNIVPLRESASYWGIYGIDFLIIFIGTTIFLLIKSRGKQRTIYSIEVSSAIFIIILFDFLSPTQNQNNKFSASIVQTKNPVNVSVAPENFLSDFSKKNELLREASKKSDLVVFPESADFSKTLLNFLDPASVPKYFSNLSQKNILVIDSDRIQEKGGLKSKVVLIDSKDGVVGSYDKLLLTPGGEYFPYISRFTLRLLTPFFKTDLTRFKAEFTQGTGSNVLYYKDSKIKLLVCSDVISPSISREGEFDFMINLRNLAVFGGSPLIEQELLSMSRFRAAENEKYLITSSNFGRSYVIDNRGNIIKSTDSSGYQILTADVVPNKERTWYNKLGDLPILLLSLAIFGLSFKNFLYAKQD